MKHRYVRLATRYFNNTEIKIQRKSIGSDIWEDDINPYFDCEKYEYREKPSVFRYKIALMEGGSGYGPTEKFLAIEDCDESDRNSIANQDNFIEYLTDWIEIEG